MSQTAAAALNSESDSDICQSTNKPKAQTYLAIKDFQNYLISKEPDSFFTITFEHLISTIALPENYLLPEYKKSLISMIIYFWPRLFFNEHESSKKELTVEYIKMAFYQIFNSTSELILLKFECIEGELLEYWSFFSVGIMFF